MTEPSTSSALGKEDAETTRLRDIKHRLGTMTTNELLALHMRLEELEEENTKMRKALEKIDTFRGWHEHEEQADIAKEALSSLPTP